jgi:hypothetical protein
MVTAESGSGMNNPDNPRSETLINQKIHFVAVATAPEELGWRAGAQWFPG